MSTTGYYGKIPLRGDFVSGRIPSTFKNPWDDWAQQLVTASDKIKQANNGKSPWLKLPVYRFYLSSKVAGDNAWTGVMLPSRDSVGRQFPFCLARDIDARLSAADCFSQQADVLTALENVIEQLYAGTLEFDSLEPSLSSIDAQYLPADAACDNPHQITGQTTGEAMSIRIGSDPTLENNSFWKTATDAILNTTCTGHSIWATSPLSNSLPETLICEAMPSPESCLSMFSGDFTQSHWTSVSHNESAGETRAKNTFLQDETVQVPALPDVDDGDTKPIRKLEANKTSQKTDFLELDDIGDTEAPWDD